MTVRYDTTGGRATITIDDPERRNPMSTQVMADLRSWTQKAVDDQGVGVIVYTGAGDKAFSAGGDLSSSFADDAIGAHHARGELAELFRLMWRGGKPTVARVNGHALAGGFGLAVACDITVCVDDAKLGTTEVNVGLWPMMISAALSRAMPRKAVLEMMLTGRVITPDEALALGAVSRVVPRERLDVAVDDIVTRLLAASPSTLMLGRDSYFAMIESDIDTALDRLQGGLTGILLTPDADEGVNAFLEKREPEWSGR